MTHTNVDTLVGSNTVTTRVYELLPLVVRQQDPEAALKTLCEAVYSDYLRYGNSARDLIALIDPYGINNRFILTGNFTFFHPEQTVSATVTSSTILTLDGIPQGAAADDAYVGFAVYVVNGNAPSIGQYRRIIDYEASTRRATLEAPWATLPTSGASFVLCWPDRVWLPTEIAQIPSTLDPGTVLPAQLPGPDASVVYLPSRPYIFAVNGYYVGWYIHFLSGDSEGSRFRIVSYSGAGRAATVESYPKVSEGDWFKLVPPEADRVSTVSDFYRDRWLRVLTGPTDPLHSPNYRVQNKRIIRSEYRPSGSELSDIVSGPATHVAFVYDPLTREGSSLEYPACPDNYFGICDTFVSMSHIANHFGYRLDADDPEDLQREQLRQAANIYRLKGSKRAFELICRTFGLASRVVERSTNYVPSPPMTDVGPGTSTPKQTYDSWGSISVPIESPSGDPVPASWLRPPGRDTARLPGSDVELFVTRLDPRVIVDGSLFKRILSKVEDVRPIHVEILSVGYFEESEETVAIEDDYTITLQTSPAEAVTISDSATVFIGGLYYVTQTDELLLGDSVSVTIPARYDYQDGFARYDTGTTRFDTGTHLL